MPVIDAHTHMFMRKFMELLKVKGSTCNLQTRPDGPVEIFRNDTPVAIPQRGHFDYEAASARRGRHPFDMATRLAD
jgi:aminocarboxymuconate-semialdehyde decarboxylase